MRVADGNACRGAGAGLVVEELHASMAAFDRLPARLRRALAAANLDYGSLQVVDLLSAGADPREVERTIAETDAAAARQYYAALRR